MYVIKTVDKVYTIQVRSKRLVLLHVFQSFVYNTDDGDDLLDNVVITNISTAFNNMNKNKTKQSKTNQICVFWTQLKFIIE